MQPTRLALLGVLSLSALLLVTACETSGTTKPLVTETQLIEVPVRQLVSVDPTLLVIPPMSPAPAPAIPPGKNCANPKGCFSNKQLEAMLSEALSSRGKAADNLRAIARAIAEAKASESKPKPP